MTATFWTGSSLSFTNGSKTVTVNTGPSLDSVKANSSLTAGNYNEPVEVKSVSGNIITLYNNWPGSTGTTSATIKPSAAAAASAGVAAQQLITEIQGLVGSASATATANSFVKRDSNGRIKAASPSSNDDVVTKGYLGSAATKDVGTAAGNLMEVGAFGYGSNNSSLHADYDDFDIPNGIYNVSPSSLGEFPNNSDKGGMLQVFKRFGGDQAQIAQIYKEDNSQRLWWRDSYGGAWQPWKELYHSGNTNFNEFGGNGSQDVVAQGVMLTSTVARFYLPLNSPVVPTSLSVTSEGFSIFSDNVLIESNVTLSLQGQSSTKIAVINVTLGTAVGTSEPVELRTLSASSKITVNF